MKEGVCSCICLLLPASLCSAPSPFLSLSSFVCVLCFTVFPVWRKEFCPGSTLLLPARTSLLGARLCPSCVARASPGLLSLLPPLSVCPGSPPGWRGCPGLCPTPGPKLSLLRWEWLGSCPMLPGKGEWEQRWVLGAPHSSASPSLGCCTALD